MNALMKQSYGRDKIAPLNKVGKYGASVYNKTDAGFGMVMITMIGGFGLIPGIVTTAIALSEGHNVITLTILLVVLSLVGAAILFTDAAVLYAKTAAAALPRYSSYSYDLSGDSYLSVESSMKNLTNDERGLVKELHDNMVTYIRNKDYSNAGKRAHKIVEISKEIVESRVVTEDNSDIMVADEFIRMMREQRGLDPVTGVRKR